MPDSLQFANSLTPAGSLVPEFRQRETAVALLVLVAMITLAGCEQSPGYHSLTGETMGTGYRVNARCPVTTAIIRSDLATELETVNAQMSTYDPDSELSRFNRAPVDEWFDVSLELVDVIIAAARISRESSGAFDVTVGPLVNLWGFGPESPTGQAPSAEQLETALAGVGHRHLETRRDPPALRKARPLYVDLSAIAKGHGVDRLAGRLAALDCTDYLVDIGGEVRALGQSPAGRPWRVGIEVPDPTRIGGVQRVLSLRASAVATSGDYRNFQDVSGERVSHTIDPRTAKPVTHRLASVSVVHPETMWADGYATALNVLGPDAGFALAESLGLPALFLTRTAAGFETRYTSGFSRFEPDN